MKKTIYLSAMLMLAFCVSTGFAQTTPSSDSKMSSDSSMKSGAKNPDSKFMMMAATSDMNEITLSQQALTKSSNDDIKKFAQMMIDDHTKSSSELKPVAESKSVTLPMDADAKHKAALTKMGSLSGDSFDMAYVKMMVKDHATAVAMFQKESNSGKDADAKAFATKTLPVIQGHYDMAKSMESKMSGSKSSAKMNGMSGM